MVCGEERKLQVLMRGERRNEREVCVRNGDGYGG